MSIGGDWSSADCGSAAAAATAERGLDLGTACLHHAAGSADRHARNGSVCGARAGCAAVSGTGAAATYLDPELALEDLLGVPPAEPGFPPFAAAERRRGDVRWLI